MNAAVNKLPVKAVQSLRAAAPEFKKLELSDRIVLEKFLARFPQRISGFTFAALFSWNSVYQYEWTPYGDGTVLISCQTPEDGDLRYFLQPVGKFESAGQEMLLGHISSMGYPVKIFGVGDEFIRKHPEFTACFDIMNDPDLANYTYRSEDLAALAGKFYAKKRNLIAQAHNLYQWSVHAMTPDNSMECMEVLGRMATANDDSGEIMQSDNAAVKASIEKFSELGQQGVIIKTDGRAVAFSIFEAISNDTAVIHFEKADRHYKGLYQIINHETAKVIASAGFSLINREEDMGVPGLRQAKLSYGPAEIVPSYTLTFRQMAQI